MAVFRTGQGLAANVLSLKNGGWKTRFLIAFSVLRIYYATFAGSCQPKLRKVALCGVCGARRWGDAAPAAGAKRKGHLRFPFLFELLPFPYQIVWRQAESGDRFEKENGSRVTVACLS